MAKKSRKKSYLKRASRRTIRRISRRKDKRKIKKTRKKRQRGGSRLSPVVSHLLEQPEFGEASGKVETIDSRSVNVLETLYKGDPEVINKSLLDYKNALELAWGEKTNGEEDDGGGDGDGDEESASFFPDKDFIYNFIKTNGINIPKYILISGHGRTENCGEYPAKCFTLLPRGFKLILATETGKTLTKLVRRPHYTHTQVNPSYYRMYEGLIPNHVISFNLIYEQTNYNVLKSDETPEKYAAEDFEDFEERAQWVAAESYRKSLYSDAGALENKLRIESCDDDDAGTYCASAILPGVNIKTVASSYDHDTSLNIFSNFHSGDIDDIPYSLAVNFQKGKCGAPKSAYKKSLNGEWVHEHSADETHNVTLAPAPAPETWTCSVCKHVYNPAKDDPANKNTPFEQLPATWKCPVCGEDDMNRYSNKFVENLEELTDDNKEHLETDAIVNLSILPKETIKNLIKTRDTMYLAQILKHIEKMRQKYENIPQVIVGSFCRSGDFNYNIDGLINHCKIPELEELKEEYFSGEINYEGVSDELRRGISLASKTKPQDFWSIIYDNINPSINKFSESVQQKFENVKRKIEIESEETDYFVSDLYKGINLSVDDVCLIFQMDQHLQMNSR